MKKRKILPRRFYERDPEGVAKDLLGKVIVRKLDDNILSGMIVETEAYYGPGDPASRAYDGMKNFNRLMWLDPGIAFIYNVHKYWMFNVVAHEPGGVGAVLIRAVEPLDGVEIMRKNRGVYDELIELTSGPGRFTVAFKIDKSLNGTDLTSAENPIYIIDNKVQFEISSSKRIGVRADLPRDLRFYIKGNKFVSKKT